MARAMCKWSVVVHAVVLAVGLLDAERHGAQATVGFSRGPRSGKNGSERPKER